MWSRFTVFGDYSGGLGVSVAGWGCILPDLPFMPDGPFDQGFRAEIEFTVKLDVSDVADIGQAPELFRVYPEPC